MRQKTVLAEVAATGGAAESVEAFRNVEVEVVMTNFTGTLKFAAANAETAPDPTNAASLANPWAYVKAINLIDGSSVVGGTGLTGAATTSVTMLEINTNGIKWIIPEVTSYTGGTLTVKVKGFGNT
jgi:hypothetical protein